MSEERHDGMEACRILDEHVRTAAQAHECYVCREAIWPGQQYRRVAFIDPELPEEVIVVKSHVDAEQCLSS